MASSDINSVVIVGRLTRDVELKYMNNGNAVASMSIAVNRSKKEGDQWVSEAHFFDVSYFGKGAEAVKPYLTKGKQIAVQGSLRQNRWEKDGQKQSRVVIVADSVELLGGNGGNGGGYSGGAGSDFNGGYQQRPSYSQPSNQSAPMGGFDMNDSFGGDSSGFSEDIPF
ncbi:MAG: single-stranded DNA-binding protein [Spirochaetia bacterium]|uniref:single-stranded DNA-binding protein n=1 Tax=Treponema sp. TaxID=166 RepID=UPI00298EC6BB|nr:single-stranded DNA-binding protein [Treponema sp.]MCI7398036.1 single-stranded DNA-binding protein [Spirochaetia bacterium]MCI7578367.1 single-stranded DNA-binding protein [Spirochaetia bacterium]